MRRLHPIPEMAPEPMSLGATPRLLAVKLAGLGDLLLTTPALRALRTRYPAGRLDLLTTPEATPLLRDSPLLDHVYTLDATPISSHHTSSPHRILSLLVGLRLNHYDAVLLLHHLTLRMGRLKHRTLLAATGSRLTAGLDNGHGGFLDLRVPDHGFGARHEADYFLAVAAAVGAQLSRGEHGPRLADLGWEDIVPRATLPASLGMGHSPPAREHGTAHVALHAGSGTYSLARRWPPERYAELARALHEEERVEVILVGGPKEAGLNREIWELLSMPEWMRLATTAEPRELAELLAACDLFVGNDSFPMHLAVAVGLPVVAVFGPSNARAWGPYAPEAGERVQVVRRADLPCSPCLYRGHALGTPGGCPPRPCLTELEPQVVLAAARRLLGQLEREADAAPMG